MSDVLQLKYLDNGGAGCTYPREHDSQSRRWFHHFTFYGFMLCFASTTVATLYHYLIAREAPYPWWDLPVVLGTLVLVSTAAIGAAIVDVLGRGEQTNAGRRGAC